MPKTQAKTKKVPKDETLKKVVSDFKSAWQYTESSYHPTWDECWKVCNGQRIHYNYEGIADTRAHMTSSTIETIISNVVSGRPNFDYLPTEPIQIPDTKKLNAQADYYWDCNDMDLKAVPWLRDVLYYGTGILFSPWGEGKPKVFNIPVKDFFVDPKARFEPDTAEYMGFRYLTTKEALESKKTVDPKTGELVPMYSNLDEIGATEGRAGEDTDKETKELFLGSTLGKEAAGKQVEVIYYLNLGTNKLIEVANRRVVIREEENPFYREGSEEAPEIKPFYPFAIQRYIIDPSLFYGRGLVESLKDKEELLNDLTNQTLDNLTYTLNTMWRISPRIQDQKDNIESMPGAVYIANEGEIEPLNKPVMTNHAAAERTNQKEEIREISGADEIVKGLTQEQGDATATEIRAQLGAAGQRFSAILRSLEAEGLKQLATIWFKEMQLFASGPQTVRVATREGVNFEVFDPVDYEGEYEPKVQLEASAKALKEEEARRYAELVETFLGDPNVNQAELKKLAFKKVFRLDDDEAEALLAAPLPELLPEGPGMDTGIYPEELAA